MINFTLEGSNSGPHINICTGDTIRINGQDRQTSVILTPEGIFDWPIQKLSDMDATHLELLLNQSADVVILGTGKQQQFPDVALLAPFMKKGIGVEVMDSSAASRTFNILMSEGRRPVAGIIIEKE